MPANGDKLEGKTPRHLRSPEERPKLDGFAGAARGRRSAMAQRDQRRRELRFVTAFMKASILQLLHEKQLVAGNTNSSIQALGEKYCSEILEMAAE